MRIKRLPVYLGCAVFLAVSGIAAFAAASAGTLRIVSYNIDDFDQGSDNNITQSYAGLPTVLQAIGQHHIGTNAQPIDVLGVEELNSTTLTNLVNAMNSLPGVTAGTYAFDPTADPTTGGGTDGLIYNTHTVHVVSATAIGAVSGSGASRAPMRYLLQPVGYGSNADFYMYVSHYKASTGSTNLNRRNIEATEIRQDADALGANAHIIYSGDFNLTGASSEAAWTTLTAAGNGQAHDPTGSTNFTNNTGSLNYLYSESTDTLNARFDFQLVSGAMLNQSGLQLASDTSDPLTGNYPSSKYPYAYEVFGNNGTTALNAVTNNGSNTSLSDLANSTTVLNDLMQFNGSNQFVGSDHLPIVADYVLIGVNPLGITWNGGGGNNNWSTAANWTSALTNGSSLTFAGAIRLSNTNDSLTSVGSITFDNTAGLFSLSGNALTTSGDITNNSTNGQTIGINLTLASAQQFNAASGPLTFNGTVANGNNLLTITGSSNTILGSTVSGAGGLAKSGAGTLTLSANNTYSGGTTVSAGTLTIGQYHALGSGGLTINNSSTTKLSNGLGTVVLPSVNINGGSATPSASFDIGANSVVIPYSGSSPFSTIKAQVLYASHGLAYDRTGGITSSSAGGSVLAVGYAEASELFLDGGGTYVNNQSPRQSPANTVISNQAVILKLTYVGDINLDGKVDINDANAQSAFFGTPIGGGADWALGDLDGNGSVDVSDVNLLLNLFGSSGLAAGDAPAAVPVPEPSTLVLAAMGLAGFAAVRIRRRQMA